MGLEFSFAFFSKALARVHFVVAFFTLSSPTFLCAVTASRKSNSGKPRASKAAPKLAATGAAAESVPSVIERPSVGWALFHFKVNRPGH